MPLSEEEHFSRILSCPDNLELHWFSAQMKRRLWISSVFTFNKRIVRKKMERNLKIFKPFNEYIYIYILMGFGGRTIKIVRDNLSSTGYETIVRNCFLKYLPMCVSSHTYVRAHRAQKGHCCLPLSGSTLFSSDPETRSLTEPGVYRCFCT